MSSSATQKGWYYIYLLVLYSLPLSVVGNTTTYYINKVKDYSSLAQCAVSPLSAVVRDMKSGCGDGGQYSSYSCFCTASSSQFANIISSAIESECGTQSDSQISTALDVFYSYCQLNTSTTASSASTHTDTTTTLSSTLSTTAAPASTSTLATLTTVQTSTSDTTSGAVSSSPTRTDVPSSKSSSSLSTGSKAAIGVCVSLGAIGIAALTFLIIRKRSHRKAQDRDGVKLNSNTATPRDIRTPDEMKPDKWQTFELMENPPRMGSHIHELSAGNVPRHV
ncbi:hypothetical protein Aspvir_003252 [Aspergillus viridinutans]|uniref:Extracellular membrane protein CFEM domain-containing protein n=1 Tax=Aspergillus viridinutans TaxID=75553 RepID=A0A9P3FB33_ASPVI|nr:uncharacterized protein Aspvir_003252 [Aspergillus viridinutans]GIK07586.1 hypothetical protein Aspvir_003252 [Aspergillus viridinutans]